MTENKGATVTPRHLDEGEVLVRLRAAAQEKILDNPDYVYERPNGSSCVNLEEDTEGELVGSCLIGRMFFNLGIPAEEDWRTGSAAYVVDVKLAHEGWTFSPGAMLLMSMAQSMQDSGVPWQYVIDAVDNVFSYLRTYDNARVREFEAAAATTEA